MSKKAETDLLCRICIPAAGHLPKNTRRLFSTLLGRAWIRKGNAIVPAGTQIGPKAVMLANHSPESNGPTENIMTCRNHARYLRRIIYPLSSDRYLMDVARKVAVDFEWLVILKLVPAWSAAAATAFSRQRKANIAKTDQSGGSHNA
jgi:hypothetical protein